MMARIHLIIVYVLIATLLGVIVYLEMNRKQQVYVDNVELFNSFKMKREIEKKYQLVENQRQSILDSLLTVVKSFPVNEKNQNEWNLLKQEYLYKKNTFEEENTKMMAQYNMEIWNQLNGYVKSYGDEKGYDFIFGANGQGGLMYANEARNVTKELIDYVNLKYAGK